MNNNKLYHLQQEKELYEESLNFLWNNSWSKKKEKILQEWIHEIINLIYPQNVISRIEEEYNDDNVLLEQAKYKLWQITMKNIDNKKWNTIEIHDKTFSFVRPKPNWVDVFSWKNWSWYEDVIYTWGSALEREVKQSGKNLFTTDKELELFLNKYLPWKTIITKIQNFADLLWLKKSWFYYIGDTFTQLSEFWYAYMCYPDKNNGYNIWFSDYNADVYPCVLANAQPIIARE